MRMFAGVAVMVGLIGTGAQADEVVVYGAGSLGEAIGQIAAEFGHAHGIAVTT